MENELTLKELLEAQEDELRQEYDAVVQNTPPNQRVRVKVACDNTLARLHNINQELVKRYSK
jgi:hypothetical protein